MAACPSFDPLGPYVTGLSSFVDCHAQALGEGGYRALGAGSSFGVVLTGLLTIYIAFIGYRMLLGTVPSLQQGVVSAMLIGFVIALATQWPSYQATFYAVAIDGPGELAARISVPSGLGDPEIGPLTNRVQAAYDILEAGSQAVAPVTRDGPGTAGGASVPRPDGLVPQAPPTASSAGSDPVSRRAGQVLLVTALAGLVSVRIVAGLLLAMGPLFITLLLFGATRGFFEGWLRGLIGAALGMLAISIILLLELAILEPQIAAWVSAQSADLSAQRPPGAILATVWLFAFCLGGAVVAVVRVAAGFRLPASIRNNHSHGMSRQFDRASVSVRTRSVDPELGHGAHPRASVIADAVSMAERRESGSFGVDRVAIGRTNGVVGESNRDGILPAAKTRLGHGYRRAQGRRASASAARRDGG